MLLMPTSLPVPRGNARALLTESPSSAAARESGLSVVAAEVLALVGVHLDHVSLLDKRGHAAHLRTAPCARYSVV